eukprot:gnl/MRDRNA2_/MRDRNA2_85465_c0_seq1.p1 gnl/MRDRNA2_/MRDRNA2_85465_c0~~gnl/MRDRNA2_/MRDRNA2_85465_c0_seq1.p1  ORF type:complete len:1217 (+),score=20.44 gnl/MRDRNA2_/MRDRNA2_85465_c0_seq1:154-3651(+)
MPTLKKPCSLNVVNYVEVFGHIRGMAALKIPGSSIDHLVVTSDSGHIVVLCWNKERNRWRKVHQETYGKAGCRRSVPGQFLVVEPRGRACLTASLERKKLVYVFNRDRDNHLTISSPHENSREATLCFSVAALDTGFENPIFAALELDVANIDDDPTGIAATNAQKVLTMYELDLGINSIIRKNSDPLDNGCNLLCPVPSGYGPGGVLVCAENFVYYRNTDLEYTASAVIPKRANFHGTRSVLLTKYDSFKNKKIGFFLILQSEFGDLYMLTLNQCGKNKSIDITINYFDTIPPSSTLCILKTGYLFASSETCNHALYKFVSLGEYKKDALSKPNDETKTQNLFGQEILNPRKLRNLERVEEIPSLSPIIDMKVDDLLCEGTPQLYVISGRNNDSSLRLLRSALTFTEKGCIELPIRPHNIFAVRASLDSPTDKYLLVSTNTSTMVLEISTECINQVTSTGIMLDAPTLSLSLMAGNSILQIYPNGIRQILPDQRLRVWEAPSDQRVEKAACNEYQVALVLGNNEIVYLELNSSNYQLVEKKRKNSQNDITAISLSICSTSICRAHFFALATSDAVVKLLSLDPTSLLEQVTLQQLEEATVSSLLFFDSELSELPYKSQHSWVSGPLFLQIGLSSGVLMRIELDRITGRFRNPKWRFLGLHPLKLIGISVRGSAAMIAMSKRLWIGYMEMGRYMLSPINCEMVDDIISFSMDKQNEGFVAIGVPKSTTGVLRFLQSGPLGEIFSQQSLQLEFTPRRLLAHAYPKIIILCEADRDYFPVNSNNLDTLGNDKKLFLLEYLSTDTLEKKGVPIWKSCIRLVDPAVMETIFKVELDVGEVAVSLSLVTFIQAENLGEVAVVGTAVNLLPTFLRPEKNFISIYRFTTYGRGLTFLHKTEVGGLPLELSSFQGRLLAALGPILRLYDIGRQHILRKAEFVQMPYLIKSLQHLGMRIFVADIQESVFILKFKRRENRFYVCAVDTEPRYVTSLCCLDYDTVIVSDKFGNVVVLRLPIDLSLKEEQDIMFGQISQDGNVQYEHYRLKQEACFYVGDVVMKLQRTILQSGGNEMIIYATIGGSIGVLLPFGLKDEADFFQLFEMHLRQDVHLLLGGDHFGYRSYYHPCRNVVDGDYCEVYPKLRRSLQQILAESLESTPRDVMKKIEGIRNKIL